MIDIYTEKKDSKDWIIQNDLYFNLNTSNEEKKICCEAGQKIFSQKVMVENYEKIYKKILEQSTD